MLNNVVRLPTRVQRHLRNKRIGDLKLSLGVNVSVNGCWSFHVGPVMSWQLIQGVTLASRQLGRAPATSCLQPCKGKRGGWTDGRTRGTMCLFFSSFCLLNIPSAGGSPIWLWCWPYFQSCPGPSCRIFWPSGPSLDDLCLWFLTGFFFVILQLNMNSWTLTKFLFI